MIDVHDLWDILRFSFKKSNNWCKKMRFGWKCFSWLKVFFTNYKMKFYKFPIDDAVLRKLKYIYVRDTWSVSSG